MPNAPFRLLVGHGVRLDRMAPFNDQALTRERRRHGFDWAMRRLSREAPRLHRYGSVAAVSLLEMWAHHEDVLDANDVGRCASGVDLKPVLRVLVRYQRRVLRAHAVRVGSPQAVLFEPTPLVQVEVRGAPADLARWLSGRGDLGGLTASGGDGDVEAIKGMVLRL